MQLPARQTIDFNTFQYSFSISIATLLRYSDDFVGAFEHLLFQDPSRLYYNNSELQQFEDVECEWPLSICFLMLDAMFSRDDAMVEHYWGIMEQV